MSDTVHRIVEAGNMTVKIIGNSAEFVVNSLNIFGNFLILLADSLIKQSQLFD